MIPWVRCEEHWEDCLTPSNCIVRAYKKEAKHSKGAVAGAGSRLGWPINQSSKANAACRFLSQNFRDTECFHLPDIVLISGFTLAMAAR